MSQIKTIDEFVRLSRVERGAWDLMLTLLQTKMDALQLMEAESEQEKQDADRRFFALLELRGQMYDTEPYLTQAAVSLDYFEQQQAQRKAAS